MSKIGSEILVNTQRISDQALGQTAKLNNGGFVTVWVDWADAEHPTVADGSWSGIKAQWFAADGAKVGPEIRVGSIPRPSTGSRIRMSRCCRTATSW